ncbi:hypothetical protein ACO1O0_007718 [Amphichorda felina]
MAPLSGRSDTNNLRPRGEGSSEAVIVGVILGSVFLVFILGAIVYIHMWRHSTPPPKKKSSKKSSKKKGDKEEEEGKKKKDKEKKKKKKKNKSKDKDKQSIPMFEIQFNPPQNGPIDNEMVAPRIQYSDEE